MKEMLLLGAGASIDAKIPDAFQMTDKIVGEVQASGSQTYSHILKFVLGGLLFQRGIQGDDPRTGVNVEELFSAIQLLGERHELEAAPFVGSWHSMVQYFETITTASPEVSGISEEIIRTVIDALQSGLTASEENYEYFAPYDRTYSGWVTENPSSKIDSIPEELRSQMSDLNSSLRIRRVLQ